MTTPHGGHCCAESSVRVATVAATMHAAPRSTRRAAARSSLLPPAISALRLILETAPPRVSLAGKEAFSVTRWFTLNPRIVYTDKPWRDGGEM